MALARIRAGRKDGLVLHRVRLDRKLHTKRSAITDMPDGNAALPAGLVADAPAAKGRRGRRAGYHDLLGRMQAATAGAGPRALTVAAAVLAEAEQAGLLDDATEHVSFRVPRALLEAAKRETGLASTTELGLVALAVLARPDPVSAAMKRTRGKLGPQHTLEY